MSRDNRGVRLGLLGVVALLLLGVLGTRLWFLQVVDAPGLSERVERLQRRTAYLPPERGRIFDADGRILADNKRVLTVTLDRDVIFSKTRRTELFTRLQGPLGMTVQQLEQDYLDDIYSPVLDYPVKVGVDEATALFLKERAEDYPGVDVREDWQRQYLYAPLASHIVGYLGAIPGDDPVTPENETEVYLQSGYQADEKVGSAGVERSFEKELRGTPGYVIKEVDTIGRVIRELERVEPIPGKDLQLTIDLDYQQYAEQTLETNLKRQRLKSPYDRSEEDVRRFTVFYPAPAGSVVVERHSTGEIVAMASYPTFDNRWFGAGITNDKFQQLFPPEDKNIPFDQRPPSPLVNRAIQGRYNVGSSYKAFTAYAALHTGFMGSNEVYTDVGVYELPEASCDREQVAKCSFKNAFNFATGAPTTYGDVTISDALAVSSDAFFYRVGAELFLANLGIAGAAERVQVVRLRREDRHRAALRVPRHRAGRGGEGPPRRAERHLRQGRRGLLRRRCGADGDRAGTHGDDAAAARQRLRHDRQRRVPAEADDPEGDLRARRSRTARCRASPTSPPGCPSRS